MPEGHYSGANHHVYKIIRVDRFDDGRYTCTADNQVGRPAKAHIDLKVLCKQSADTDLCLTGSVFMWEQRICVWEVRPWFSVRAKLNGRIGNQNMVFGFLESAKNVLKASRTALFLLLFANLSDSRNPQTIFWIPVPGTIVPFRYYIQIFV